MTEKKNSGQKNAGLKDPVAFVEDPFAFPNVAVEEAQGSSEELVLDEDFETEDDAEVDAQMSRLGGAMAAEHERNLKELERTAEGEAADPSKDELARQIAEDEAVEREAAEAEDAADAGVSS